MTSFQIWLRTELFKTPGNMREIADEAQIAPQLLYRYYKGIQTPNLKTFKKICRALAKMNQKNIEEYYVAGLQKLEI